MALADLVLFGGMAAVLLLLSLMFNTSIFYRLVNLKGFVPSFKLLLILVCLLAASNGCAFPDKEILAQKEECEGKFTLIHHFWDRASLPEHLSARAEDVTRQERGFAYQVSFSRTLGRELRLCAGEGKCGRISGEKAILKLLHQDGRLYREVGVIKASSSGLAVAEISIEEANSKIISLLFSDNFLSPPLGANKMRELRSLPQEHRGQCGTQTHSLS